MTQLRLVQIITGLSTGGAETMLLKVLEHIDRSLFSPHVISLTKGGEIGSRIESLGIPVETLGMRPGHFGPTQFLWLTKRLTELRPDIVHTWMYHADLVGGLAARLAGIRATGWGIRHSNLAPEHNKRSTLRVVKACAVLSHWVPRAILCCSEAAKVIHIRFGYDGTKITVVPNGFDLDRFMPNPEARNSIRCELGLAAETPLVGLIARFDPQKNHIGFIRAAALVYKQRPDTHFLLAGSGVHNSNEPLMGAIKAAGVMKATHLLSRRDDIWQVMAALDVSVSSSHGEAFPNVLGEAMACGVPCVVTDVGDSAEIVGDTGRVVRPNDMEGLASSILEVLSLSQVDRTRLGGRARERIMLNFDINKIARRYEQFYLGLVNRDRLCAG